MLRKTLVWLIRFYQRFLSPVKPQTYRCRYYPTCSQYTIEALNRFGVGKGVILGLCRLLSCHPWRPGAVDQVPEIWPGWKGLLRRKRGF